MAAEASCVLALIISINTFKLLNFRNGENFIFSISLGTESLFNSLTFLNRAPKNSAKREGHCFVDHLELQCIYFMADIVQ